MPKQPKTTSKQKQPERRIYKITHHWKPGPAGPDDVERWKKIVQKLRRMVASLPKPNKTKGETDLSIHSWIDQRNGIQFYGEALGDIVAVECWERLNVANCHIDRVTKGSAPFTPAVEDEIADCVDRTFCWLRDEFGLLCIDWESEIENRILAFDGEQLRRYFDRHASYEPDLTPAAYEIHVGSATLFGDDLADLWSRLEAHILELRQHNENHDEPKP
jgi:hypothetical protein